MLTGTVIAYCGSEPSGVGSSQRTVTPQVYTITVRWDEPTPDGSLPQYAITVPVNTF